MDCHPDFHPTRQAGVQLSLHASAIRLLEQFLADARLADERMQKSGLGYTTADVHRYLEGKITGGKATRPKPAPWRG